MHGKYPRRAKEADIDQRKAKQLLNAKGLKSETEGLIFAAHTLLKQWGLDYRTIRTASLQNLMLRSTTAWSCCSQPVTQPIRGRVLKSGWQSENKYGYALCARNFWLTKIRRKWKVKRPDNLLLVQDLSTV